MTSETTRMAEAELLAEVDRLRAEVDWLRVLLANSVPKADLTREQRIEVALRQRLAGATVVRAGSEA